MNTALSKFVPLLFVALGLVACGADGDELEAYISATKARPGGRIEPLPTLQSYEPFMYVADSEGLRSPFVPEAAVARADSPVTPSGGTGRRPDQNREREDLEDFPLDTLRMVGTLAAGGIHYALVRSSDGEVHRVTTGNYMGQNNGRIVDISAAEIRLAEAVADGLGGYTERSASIAFINNYRE